MSTMVNKQVLPYKSRLTHIVGTLVSVLNFGGHRPAMYRTSQFVKSRLAFTPDIAACFVIVAATYHTTE